MAAVSVIGVSIYSLSFQHSATKSQLPSPSNATYAWEAFNVTAAFSTDATSVLGGALPLLAGLVFLALVATMALTFGGGR